MVAGTSTSPPRLATWHGSACYVLQSKGADPFGEYAFPADTREGKLGDASDKWAIDGTVLDHKGERYFLWSGWGGMSTSRSGSISPRWPRPGRWQDPESRSPGPCIPGRRVGTPQVNEGPQVLWSPHGRLFIVYSASGSWTDDYCLGLLELVGEDPLNPAHWAKRERPVFAKDEAVGVYGPGHNGFFTDGQGQPWLIHHAAKFSGAGWNREIHMQPFGWDEQGLPLFGSPIGTRPALMASPGTRGRDVSRWLPWGC